MSMKPNHSKYLSSQLFDRGICHNRNKKHYENIITEQNGKIIAKQNESSIFAHGVQDIIQMELKTNKMILLHKHMRAKESDFSLSKLAVDRALHVSGILSMTQWDIWSPSVQNKEILLSVGQAMALLSCRVWIFHGSLGARGTKLLCNCEEFLEKIWVGRNNSWQININVFQVINLNAAKSFENGEGVRLIAPQDACKLQPFSQKLGHNGEVFLDRQCHDLGGEESTVYVIIRQGCSGTYTWLSRLHNREPEDKAKEVPELKAERHKKKLNMDKLEGIARLKLAEAAMLQLKANKA
ncbi:hypothetical protein F2Q70_00033352 [Brassica cretica]|uniref:Oberon coiled-coil region domain-containing protein n=1 Tax=Brassica cretica TaxID=69181 RepID=A0A8S9FJ90_BRACR|nr:hypothetical protein F2Q70_00033352 [Brassica cretica]